MRKNYKPLIMGILCALIVVMAIGFALLSQELNITGTSHIDSNWNIRITNIRVKNLNSGYASGTNAAADVSGSTGCTTQTAPCNATTANFEAKLVTPGDYIVYEVTITNSGTLDGVVESINLSCSENEAITCTTSGLNVADTISHTSPNNTNTVDVTVTYNNSTETQPSNTNSTITLTVNYQQDLGQVTVTYPLYSVGDDVTFAGSNWKVIKNSSINEDYVTLMKETVLTNAELGTYAYESVHSSAKYSLTHVDNYADSTIKQAVDSYMNNYLDESELKEIDNYKIRLITIDELVNNLGCTTSTCTSSSNASWLYGNGIGHYWIMEPKDSTTAYFVKTDGSIFYEYQDGNGRSLSYGSHVRPVINLLKSAIPQQS